MLVINMASRTDHASRRRRSGTRLGLSIFPKLNGATIVEGQNARAWRPGGQVKGGPYARARGRSKRNVLQDRLIIATPRPPEAAGNQECEEALYRSHTRPLEAHKCL